MTDGRQRSFAAPSRYDLDGTLSLHRVGGGDPSYRAAADGVWRATNTPDGAATLNISRDERNITARAWGPGAQWALDRAPALAGMDDDPDALDPTAEPAVADAVRRHAGLRFGASGRVIEAVIPAIIGQKVTNVEAKSSYRRLTLALGEHAPGPVELHTPPTPARLAEAGYADLHRFGIERQRAEVVLRIVRRADTFERLVADPSDGASTRLGARLREIPGIGPWTEALVRQRALGDPDAVAVGDFNLPSIVSWALRGERRGDDVRMLELLEPFIGQRARVARLIKMSSGKPPRRAPRQRLRSIERY